MTTTRRQFLIASLSGLGASLLSVGCGDVFSQPPPDDTESPPPKEGRQRFPATDLELTELLAEYFDGAEISNVQLVGEVYLGRFGGGDEAGVEDLAETVEIVSDVGEMTDALTRWDRAAIEDFETDGIAAVSGWQLARTEARLCGLAYHLL